MLLCKCEHCEQKFRVNDELAGKRIRCPQCRQAISVPISSDVPAATLPNVARPTISSRINQPTVGMISDVIGESQQPAPTSQPKNYSESDRHRFQSNEQTINHPNHRRWVALMVIVALISAPFMPALSLWLGITILALCMGAFIQIGAHRLRLSERIDTRNRLGAIGSRMLVILPVFQDFSRRVLRLSSREKWRSHLRLVMYALLGLVLILAGRTGARFIAERGIVVAKKAAEESERQRLTAEANATVASFVRDAETALSADNLSVAQNKLEAASKTPNATDFDGVRGLRTRLANAKVAILLADATKALNAGNVEAGRQKIQVALALPNADELAAVSKLDQQITNAIEPTRIRELLMELSDEDFQKLKDDGTMPSQMLSGYQGLDERSAELATAAVEQVVDARESRRLAQLDAERKLQEEARISAEASAHKAKADRDSKEKSRLAAAVDTGKGQEKPIRRGSAAYIEVDGENDVWVSINEKALDELNSFSAARNEDAITQMMQQGRVLVCAKGTKVSVVDPGVFSTTIRIMEGKHSGLTGIIPNEFLHNSAEQEAPLPANAAARPAITAIIRSSKLVDFVSPTNGQKFQMLMVTLKNTGSTHVRVVDADITWRDSSGNVLGSHNYTIFAEFDSSPGIAPGGTWTTRKGEGFLIPGYGVGDGARAKSVKVEITKVLEHSGI